MHPMDVSYFLKVWGVEFPSSSHCSHQLFIVSHQIPLVPINNPSKSFCSHQLEVLIKFFLFPSTSHQFIFVPNSILHKPTQSSKLWHKQFVLWLENLAVEMVPWWRKTKKL